MIANEFGESSNDPLHASALFAAGLVLFVLTLIVNLIARRFVIRGTRGSRTAGGDVGTDVVVEAQAATVGGGAVE